MSNNAMVQNFAIENTTKGKLPSLPFLRIKERVLGKHYELSVVFIGDKRSRDLNKRYRGKDRPTNILSFPLSASEGEIFINLRQAKKMRLALKNVIIHSSDSCLSMVFCI